MHRLREKYGQETRIGCGYEAGCLGYTLYHQLTKAKIECIILAPTTLPSPRGGKRVKTDGRDAANIAQCLAYGTYSPVHVPSAEDEQVKEFIRMRNDHCQMLKKLKQQILSFCLRHGYLYSGTRSNWTQGAYEMAGCFATGRTAGGYAGRIPDQFSVSSKQAGTIRQTH
ncbi:MAG: IS110 family transposase [Christensenellales bacterium]